MYGVHEDGTTNLHDEPTKRRWSNETPRSVHRSIHYQKTDATEHLATYVRSSETKSVDNWSSKSEDVAVQERMIHAGMGSKLVALGKRYHS